MAANLIYATGRRLVVAVASGTVSGDPVLAGQLPGVAITTRDGDGMATIDCGGVYLLSVKGVDGSGDAAVAEGDVLYFVSGDTPKLSRKATGVRFGYALEPVASGATTTIAVKLGY